VSKRIFTSAGVIQRLTGVEADLHLGRRDPAAERHERGRVGQDDARLLLELAHRRGAQGGVALALGAIHRAAGEHPHAAHEARVGVALDEQQLERVGAAAQQDHGGRQARRRHGAGAQLLARTGPIDLLHRPHPMVLAMNTETTTRKWICEACGFIYDPADGDPDGGIPAGTAFEDIPDSWFCPVCGARKRDFTPHAD
jgi:rubredoxin